MEDQAENSRELTYGEKVVGLDFNPSGNPKVQRLKELLASAIDIVEDTDNPERSQLGGKLDELAVDQLLLAQMAAVKAVTFKQ